MRAPTCSLYFAYGSNLSIRRMQNRCPAATPLHKFKLEDSKLVFRGVADCPRVEGSVCYGGLWRITAECEESLDRYEGVHGGFYRKDYIPLNPGEFEDSHLMLYVMNSTGVFPPAHSYLETIAQGYRDFQLPMADLKEAVAYSHDHRSPSGAELRRHSRLGHPRLASRPLLPGETEAPLPYREPREIREPMLDDEMFEPPQKKRRGESRKWDGTSRTRASLDDWLEERRRESAHIVRRMTEQRAGKRQYKTGNFDLFDEWWHSPLTDTD